MITWVSNHEASKEIRRVSNRAITKADPRKLKSRIESGVGDLHSDLTSRPSPGEDNLLVAMTSHFDLLGRNARSHLDPLGPP